MSFLGQARSKLCGKHLLQRGPHVCETTLVLSNLQHRHQRWTDFQPAEKDPQTLDAGLGTSKEKVQTQQVCCCRIPGDAPSVALSILFPTTSRPASSKHKTPCSSECHFARGYFTKLLLVRGPPAVLDNFAMDRLTEAPDLLPKFAEIAYSKRQQA
ncbi:unnamed protein product [Symbiodinium sp. CCMP2592]|nr:unnamed protein product [Symbiodinium sp. CCMP2592]